MATIHSRPTVFISSTISDFSDLRGALKFWLEESGYEVWLSEYNDMEKSPGANTFEACFETICRADFHILLIGERRGSLYSEPHNTSVTQQEYRVARDSFSKLGRPIPLLFVRASVKDQLAGWRSGNQSGKGPFDDAVFVESFISEVERVQETGGAVKGIGPYPLANWLHRFNDLPDIIDALRVALSLKVNIPLQRLLSGIQLDLEVTLSALLQKHQLNVKQAPGADILRKTLENIPGIDLKTINQIAATIGELELPFPGHWLASSVAEQNPLNSENKSPISLDAEQKYRLTMYLIGGRANPDRIWLNALRQAVTRGDLFSYDPSTRSFQDTELSLAASKLIEDAEIYEQRYRTVESRLNQILSQLQYNRVDWHDALFLWGLYHSQVNLFRRVASLYAHLKGLKDTPSAESLLPGTPLGSDTEEKIKRESASRSDIQEWVKLPSFWNF